MIPNVSKLGLLLSDGWSSPHVYLLDDIVVYDARVADARKKNEKELVRHQIPNKQWNT